MYTPILISADEAVNLIPSNSHIHFSGVACTPHCIIDALCRKGDKGELNNVSIHHLHTLGQAPYSDIRYSGVFFDCGFFIGRNVRHNLNSGCSDYIPVHLSETQKLYRSGAIPLSVAFVSITPPNKDGFVSLGPAIDCSLGAICSAKVVVGIINENIPFTFGDLVDIKHFNYFVYDDYPLMEDIYSEPNEIDLLVGKRCAELIDDGDCIQMGIGGLPNAIAHELSNHKNLGLHTEMFSDELRTLIEKGIINGSKKQIDIGKVVSSFAQGSLSTYLFLDKNPNILFKDIGYTNDPIIISRNNNVKSINAAIEIDLTGQVCADSIGSRIYGGTGGQLDFVRGASLSKGGKSVIALSSRTYTGGGKIVPLLRQSAGVTTTRADVHWVVTEYGAVDLYGKSLQERSKLLISIAHPEDREFLSEAAFKRYKRIIV